MVAKLKMILKAVLQNKDTHNVSNNKQCISNNRLTDLEWSIANTTRGLKYILLAVLFVVKTRQHITKANTLKKSYKSK